MKSNLTFRLSGQNSLKINEIPVEKERNLLNTFKGGNDLRNQLGQTKLKTKAPKIDKKLQNTQKELLRSNNDILAQQVAALDNFKVPVTRQKTKNMIESIKLRRRQKHIDMMNRFREDLDDYKENLLNLYSSITNDIEQVMNIKENSLQQYLKSCDNDEYLLSREKDFVKEVKEQLSNYRAECEIKINTAKQDFEKIKSGRGNVIQETCQGLRQALIQIAFILQPEARQIEEEEKKQIEKLQNKYYEDHAEKFQKLSEKQNERNQKIEKNTEEVVSRWRTLKEDYELESYKKDAESDKLRNPDERVALYKNLQDIQLKNNQRKKKLLHNFILENPDTVNKNNINKWNEELKKINDAFDGQFDENLKQLMGVEEKVKNGNVNRYDYCKQRLNYIEKHNEEEVQEILKEHCLPLLQRNNSQAQKLTKKSTDYVQNLDQRQNEVLTGVVSFITKLGTLNDDFVAKFTSVNQKYEIQKAKILDEDEETAQKLNEELNELKKELRQSLHHLKLQEVENKCFSKVDQMQNAYRNCHQKNKELTDTRAPTINDFFKEFEDKIAQIFQLYDPSRRKELQQKNQKESEDEAMKRIEMEDKKKAQEEERIIEQTKKKGGKPPPAAKPKDPKKLAAQIEERKKNILAEMGPKTIEQLKSDTGSVWLVFRTIQQICSQFYKIKEGQQKEGEKKQVEEKKEESGGQNNEEEKKEQQEKQKPIDFVEEPLKDCRGQPVVTDQAFIKISELVPELTLMREKFFDNLGMKKVRVLNQAQQADQQLLQDSLITLDGRLKEHYSLKGKIESQIYVKRSGEITNHKKKYEKYVRVIKQKMDLQTQKFNFLLQKGLQSMKEHNSEQKGLREHIPEGKNLSQLQGLQSRTRQNFNSFGMTMKEICNELDRLCNAEVDVLLQKNQNFIKDSKLFLDGGEYSDQQVNWYKQMLEEITKQMKEQQQKRIQKMNQLKQHTEKRRKELFDAFQKEYILAIEQLSAKDGTGKKYGRPKRIAQQKTRFEMNKCEQAQINIDKAISEIKGTYERVKSHGFRFKEGLPTLQWRRKLMTIQFCIIRYAKHIQALKSDLKIAQMIRVNYNQKLCDSKLPPEEEQEDKKRIVEELSILGSLSEQKDEKIFMKYIEDIEKIISDESRTIYVGDKAKYLTGNDKIPDFLRVYITAMKKAAEEFRLNSIRQLRESCCRFAQIMGKMSQLFFTSILYYYSNEQGQNTNKAVKQYNNFYLKHKKDREQNLQRLRPNLSNPKCQEELAALDEKQKTRTVDYVKVLEEMQKQFKDSHFSNAETFLTTILNNYDFLLLYTDSIYLYEDFAKLPGDEAEEKKHLDIKRLMIMKQKGIKIDTQSERNIRKKWDGIDFKVFNIEDRKYAYKVASEEVPKEKEKKGGKKDSKDPKKEQVQEPENSLTKVIETFKTWRQKSVFTARNESYENYKKDYENDLQKTIELMEKGLKENSSFDIKWKQISKQLYL